MARFVEQDGRRVLAEWRDGRWQILEARPAAGAAKTKWDGMDVDELRKRIADMKARGDKAPTMSLLRATQALARKLTETWQQWDEARKWGEFQHMKSGPIPGGHVPDSPGRGPSGKLRNFKAMSNAKLTDTAKALILHGEDPDALFAVHDELSFRGVKGQNSIPEGSHSDGQLALT